MGDGFPLIGKSQRQTSEPPPPSLMELAGTHPDSKLVGHGGDPCQEMAKGMMTDADWKDDERWNKNRSET